MNDVADVVGSAASELEGLAEAVEEEEEDELAGALPDDAAEPEPELLQPATRRAVLTRAADATPSFFVFCKGLLLTIDAAAAHRAGARHLSTERWLGLARTDVLEHRTGGVNGP
ncbi:hypothetical protein [Leekyejoonella antrihumi]|uniref:Uncharacterized protein n=1 Tax=Leekyejoonella antrihumi TaxID=1660198 RepID=A0A563E263_9MICO|nr:hypothetical protein [Leekyejoonella antrihumi]TWP36379.1 hypothetical protein FGL98_10500 [Leekyejoonella antrihumi]